MEIDILQKRAADGGFRRHPSSIFSRSAARAHHGHAHLGHHGPHVSEVDVDHAGANNEVGNPLHSAQQHVVGRAEGVEHGGALPEHGQQLFVGNGDQGIHVLLELENALVRRRVPLLEAEGAGHHGHR